MSTQAWILAVFVIYFSAIIIMAVHFRRSRNLSDYYLASRGLNTWVGALSAQTSDMSGWLLMGLPGAVYAAGVGASWIAIGLIIGTAINWFFVAKKLRRYTIIANNSVTLPEYLENRFHDKSHVLKMVAAIFFAIFFTLYAASGFVAGGTLLPLIFGINYQLAVIILASFVVIYTLIGGLKAISWTDTIQGMMMLAAVFFLPLIVIATMGGWSAVSAGIDQPGFFNLFAGAGGGTISAMAVISGLSWGLGYFGMPHILIKLIAIKKERYVHRSAVIALVWVLIALTSAVLVGLVGRSFVPGLGLEGQPRPDTVFIQMIQRIFLDNGAIWAILLGGLFLCGMFAAIKSTADSQLLVGSSAISDIFKTVNKKASDKNLVWFSRGAVLAVALVALYIALNAYDPAIGGPNRNTGVMQLVAAAWAGFGSAFGPLVLCSLFWKRTNRVGGTAGVVVGGATVLIWRYWPLVQGTDGLETVYASTGLNPIVPGFVLSLIAIFIGSLVTAKPSKQILQEFEKACKPLKED